MASTIAAGITNSTALVYTADTSGVLQLQTNGTTTAATFDTNQNMGLGTTTPTQKLTVQTGTGAFGLLHTNGTVGIGSYVGAATGFIGTSTNHPIGFFTNNSSVQMILDTNGNLGLGVTPSAWKTGWRALQIGGTSGSGGSIYTNSGGANAQQIGIGSNWYYDQSSGNNLRIGAGYAADYYLYNGTHVWSIASSSTAGSTISFTQAMTLANSGNLLLGTTTDGGQPLQVLYSGSSLATTATFRNSCATTGNQYGNVQYLTGDPNNNSNYFYACFGNNTNRTTIYSNGGIANYSANNTNLSDATLKKDITPAKSYLSILNQIPVVTFLFNDQTDTETNLGVTAQSVQAVAPELVGTMDVGTKEAPNVKLAIYETDLKYAMLKAIQELSAQVTTLQSKVAALKA